MRPRLDAGESRRYGRGAGLLSLAIGASGLLTYGYFALASHELDAGAYGSLVVLWSALFVAVVTLYRPVEQFLSRSLAEREAVDEPLGGALRVAGLIQLGLVAVLVVLMLALREPIEEDLLSGDATLYRVMLVAAPAYAASFLARGYLGGRRRFGLYGAMLLLEATSRFSLAVAVVAGLASGVDAVALGIVVAPLLSLLVVPALARRELRGRAGRAPAHASGADLTVEGAESATSLVPATGMAAGGRFVAAAFVVMLAEQALLNAGVVIVRAVEGAIAAGLIFNVLLLARAPQVLFGAVTTSLLPTLTRLYAGGGEHATRAFAGSIRGTAALTAAFTALVALVVAAAGPELMQLAFGPCLDYDRLDLLIVVAGMGAHLISLTLTQAALARGERATVAARWAVCAVGFVVWSLLGPFEAVVRVEVGYAAAMGLLALLLLALSRCAEQPAPTPA